MTDTRAVCDTHLEIINGRSEKFVLQQTAVRHAVLAAVDVGFASLAGLTGRLESVLLKPHSEKLVRHQNVTQISIQHVSNNHRDGVQTTAEMAKFET